MLGWDPCNGFDVSVGEVGTFNPAGFENCEKLFHHIRYKTITKHNSRVFI
jgi:hypothetical protein